MSDGRIFITPLFRIPQGKAPEQGASGTWLAIGNERFLITAAHEVDEKFLWFPGTEGLRQIKGPGIFTAKTEQTRTLDRVDLAIFHLTLEDQTVRGENYDFVDISNVDTNGACKEGEFYEFTGYPYRKSEFDIKRNRGEITFASVISNAASESEVEKLGLSAKTHIVVRYTKKNMLLHEKRINVPLLHGVSGGAVWRIENSGSRILAGISIECPKGYLVGVRITAALEFIRSWLPRISSLIPQPEDLDVIVLKNGKPIQTGQSTVPL